MIDDQAVKSFFESIKPMYGIYKRCRITCLASEYNGKWRNIATEVVFDVGEGSFLIPQELSKLPHPLRVFRFAVACTNLEMQRLFHDLSAGRLIFKGQTIVLHELVQDTFPESQIRFIHRPSSATAINSKTNIIGPFESLESLSGESLISFVPTTSSFNRQLQGLTPPFEDLTDIGHLLFLWQSELTSNSTSTVRVIAPWYAHLDESKWKESGNLELVVKSDYEFDQSMLSLGYISTRMDGMRNRDKLQLTRSDSTSGKFSYVGFVPEKEAETVTAILLVGDKSIEQKTYHKPVPGIQLLQHFPHSLTAIKDYLATAAGRGSKVPKGDRAKIYVNKFEVGIMFLLQLCQWDCQPHGIIEGKDSADGIALNRETDQAIVYECSFETPQYKDKCSHLFIRARSLQKHLPRYHFVPIMFTAFVRNDVPPSELQKAKESGILVVCQDDILEWFSRLEAGLPVDIIAWGRESMSPTWGNIDEGSSGA